MADGVATGAAGTHRRRIALVALAVIAALLVVAPQVKAAPGVAIIPLDSAGSEAGDTGSYTFVLTEAPSDTVTVTVGPDSQVNVDKTTLTFTTGDWNVAQTVTVTPVDDAVYEGSHIGVVSHSAIGGGYDSESWGTYTVTITDNELAPSISINNVTVGEGAGTASFTVSLSPPSASTVTVNYATANDTATAGSDYTAASGTVTFVPLDTSETINVAITQDATDEIDETFNVNLSSPSGAGISDGLGVGTITDDDPAPTVSIAADTVLEGGIAAFIVTLSAPSGKTVTVNYTTANDTAIAGFDYTAASGTVTFVPGDTSETINVSTTSDIIDEGAAETFTVNLSGAVNATILGASAIGTITDDDVARLSVSDATSVVEGGAAAFTVTLSNPSSSVVTVQYSTANVTAVAPGDYTPIAAGPASTLTFPAGTTIPTPQVINVTTIDDALDEATETFTVDLSLAVNAAILDGSGTGTILDNDGAPGLSVIDAVPVTEGPGLVQLKYTVVLLPASGQAVTVDYATANGTAVAPGDYTAIPTTQLLFIPGQTTKDVLVTVVDDAIDEIDETVLLNLSNATNTTIEDAQGTGTIKDNDNAPPEIDKFLITDQANLPRTSFTQNETVKVTVDFSDPGLFDVHEVRVSWEDGTPDFYQVVTGFGSEQRTIVATHKYQVAALHTITVIITDEAGAEVRQDAVPILVEAGGELDTVGLVDPTQGIWHLRNAVGAVTSFYYGNPGDYPIVGDWNCDGVDTPGMYRQSDGYVYLRNSNSVGVADIRFFFGNPGDIPIAGDFNGDGCDTVSIFRPSEGRVFIINALGANEGGLGAAELDYYFGNPGDKPFVGDFDADGIETIGLHRESTGLVYFRNSHTPGVADNQFIFGDPNDRLVAGDWVLNGYDTPALFRPSNTTFYFKHTNTTGVADNQFVYGEPPFLPVAGAFGLP